MDFIYQAIVTLKIVLLLHFLESLTHADIIYMKNTNIMHCSSCNQQLNIPQNIGGMVMVCPTCGHKFNTDFKLAGTTGQTVVSDNETENQSPRKKAGGVFSIVV